MKTNSVLKASGCLLLGFLFTLSVQAQKKEIFMGGRIALTLPTNMGKSKDLQSGFKDMSTTGFQVGYFGRWFYMENLSLGWDIAYQYQSTNDDYWNVSNRGEVNGGYHTIQLLAEGNFYFSRDEVRPYAGMAFGAFALFNNRTYQSNNELAAASNTYNYQKIMPGLAPQVGLLFELSRKTMLDIHARFVMMPNLEPEYVYDENLGEVSTNPHGAQNHLSLSVGLLF
nr:outer membrane beta-barrel protein [uncultured Carboxylicivirga sp.]